jgi:hypothetical protein
VIIPFSFWKVLTILQGKKRSFKTGKDVWLREEKLVEKMKANALHLLQVSEQKHWWQD